MPRKDHRRFKQIPSRKTTVVKKDVESVINATTSVTKVGFDSSRNDTIATIDTDSISNAPTEEDSETKYTPTDEAFHYLQNLNSDNLMKLSQQSAIMQMINEEVNMKPNISLLPSYEEHDQAGYNFRISVNTLQTRCGRKQSSFVYSHRLKKIYVKMNDKVPIDVYYTLKMPIQPLRIRVFMIFSKDISEPVSRCQNHLWKDENDNMVVRQSMIRCEQSDVEYYGSESGKSIKDRFSIVLPANACIQPQHNELKHQFLLSFTCNNSCLGRKETSAMFLLESITGEIFGQRFLNVKVCSCPKRDMSMDEKEPFNNIKRICESPIKNLKDIKIPKLDGDSYIQSKECDESSNSELISDYSIGKDSRDMINVDYNMGKFVLTLRLSKREEMLESIGQLYANAKRKEALQQCPSESYIYKRAYSKVFSLAKPI